LNTLHGTTPSGRHCKTSRVAPKATKSISNRGTRATQPRTASYASDRASVLPASLPLDREGTTATTGPGRVRIAEREARAHHRVDVVNLNSVEILLREHVDEDPQTILVQNLIALPRRVFDLHRIREPAAAARHHADSQPGFCARALGFHEFFDFSNGRLCQCQ